jgi:predicted O-methyltransferase YrrM
MFDTEIPCWVLENKVPGWINDGDLIALYLLASGLPKNSIIVEVGSLFGKSAVQIAKSAPSSSVYCFDLWNGYFTSGSDDINRYNNIETFQFFTKDYLNIKPIKIKKSPDSAEWGDDPIDMIFLDTSHHNPSDWEIIEYWINKLNHNGLLCGHDYQDENPPWPDVYENVKKLEKMLGKTVTTYNKSTVWSFKI